MIKTDSQNGKKYLNEKRKCDYHIVMMKWALLIFLSNLVFPSLFGLPMKFFQIA